VNYFSKTYGEARWSFKEAALDMSKKYQFAEYRTIRIPSRTDPDLTIDTFYVPAQVKHERLVLMTSGIHGIEGMAGSAIELFCMRDKAFTSGIDQAETGFLFIHGLNPFGQKYCRRVTENNVDLGCNFRNSGRYVASTDNEPGIAEKLSRIVNPTQKYSQRKIPGLFFFLRFLPLIVRYGETILRQVFAEGQYTAEKAIFFGGKTPEPQVQIISDILNDFLGDYKKVLAIDIHSGEGKPGEIGFHLPFGNDDPALRQSIEKIFSDDCLVRLSNNNRKKTNDFTTCAAGSIAGFVYNFSKSGTCIPLVMKIGTRENRSIAKKLSMLRIISKENQCFQFGYKTEKDKKWIQKSFNEIFYPQNEKWRETVLHRAKETLPILFTRFQNL
jgi:hypothetical protein